MKVKIKDHVYFAYCRDLEYVAAAAGILADNLDGRLCREIYGEEFIAKMKRKHRELVEIINSLYLGGLEFLEFLMNYETKEFHLNEYRQYVESLPQDQFVYQFFGYRASMKEVREALQDEEKLSKLMDEGKLLISSYVNLKRIINRREEFFDLYFTCLSDIQTPELEEYLDRYEKMIPRLQQELELQLDEKEAIDVAQDILNKCYLRERSYENYGFLPVAMLPRNAVVYYDKNQFLLYSKNRMVSRQKALDILKVLSDDKRIRIVDLVSESGRANGKKISHWTQISPSTVSHHMEQLVDCGIVKEEKVGNTKEYTICREAGENFIKELEGIILKNLEHKN